MLLCSLHAWATVLLTTAGRQSDVRILVRVALKKVVVSPMLQAHTVRGGAVRASQSAAIVCHIRD
eukprot:36755-Eustigmatos_ZCMA.PRE.1